MEKTWTTTSCVYMTSNSWDLPTSEQNNQSREGNFLFFIRSRTFHVLIICFSTINCVFANNHSLPPLLTVFIHSSFEADVFTSFSLSIIAESFIEKFAKVITTEYIRCNDMWSMELTSHYRHEVHFDKTWRHY